MHKLYTTNDIVKDTGCSKATVGLWVEKNWIRPCSMPGSASTAPDRFFTQAEHDRIMDAVRSAEGRPRKIFIFLNRTLHEIKECNAVACAELASRCGCCENTIRMALARMGYPKNRSVAVIEEDVDEVKAVVQNIRKEGQKKRAEARKSSAVSPGSAGNITVHVKGLTITLNRKDAEALAEEILAQI